VAQEKGKFGEQALNKIAEIALASQLAQAEGLEVRIKTDLSKLAHGELDSIAIKIDGLLMPQNLHVDELKLQINRIIVKPFSALLGKIILTQPCDGTIRIAINEDSLTRILNSKSFYEHLHQIQGSVEDKRIAIDVRQVRCCLLADGKIAFNCQVIEDKAGEAQTLAFTAIPRIVTDGQGIILQDVDYLDGKELLPELTAALVAQVSEVLSFRKFQQQGMSLRIQQINVAVGKLTLQADVWVERFPSSK
jgi:hypothetical protein